MICPPGSFKKREQKKRLSLWPDLGSSSGLSVLSSCGCQASPHTAPPLSIFIFSSPALFRMDTIPEARPRAMWSPSEVHAHELIFDGVLCFWRGRGSNSNYCPCTKNFKALYLSLTAKTSGPCFEVSILLDGHLEGQYLHFWPK